MIILKQIAVIDWIELAAEAFAQADAQQAIDREASAR